MKETKKSMIEVAGEGVALFVMITFIGVWFAVDHVMTEYERRHTDGR